MFSARFDVPLGSSKGYTFKENNSIARCMWGPKMVLSDIICSGEVAYTNYLKCVGQTEAPAGVKVSEMVHWKFVGMNACWGLGIVPEKSIQDDTYLHVKGVVGLNSNYTGGGVLPVYHMHGKTVEVLASRVKVVIKVDGIVVRTYDLPYRGVEEPFRLALSGFSSAEFGLIEDSTSSPVLQVWDCCLNENLSASGCKPGTHPNPFP